MFYEMVADIYIILIAPKATNPFAGTPKLAMAKSYAPHIPRALRSWLTQLSAVTAACKGELGEARVSKATAEVRAALLRVLLDEPLSAAAAPAPTGSARKVCTSLADSHQASPLTAQQPDAVDHPGWMVQQQTLLENMKLYALSPPTLSPISGVLSQSLPFRGGQSSGHLKFGSDSGRMEVLASFTTAAPPGVFTIPPATLPEHHSPSYVPLDSCNL